MSITPFTPALGPIVPRLVFATLDDARYAMRAVIGRAQRRVTIASPRLEPELYEHPAVLQALTRFILGPGYRRVRILLTEAEHTPGPQHALLALSRKLSTSFDLRIIPAHVPTPAATYLVADRDATVLRLNAGEWSGMYALENPAAARTHLSHFESLWQTCPADEDAAIAL
jgi:hypothetical protein